MEAAGTWNQPVVDQVLGKRAAIDIAEDEVLTWEKLT